MATLPETARTIFQQALADCDVERATVRRFSQRDGWLHIDDDAIDLRGLKRVAIVAVGKAANAMLAAVWKEFASLPNVEIGGIVIAPERSAQLPEGFQYFAGGHPLPNEASFAGARAALEAMRAVAKNPEHTLCLFLISGGASAMMELPLDPTITLAETANFYRVLVASGASITEINCVRKHFSAVKGGWLAMAAGGALCRSLLISDVPAGREGALGSGPTLPDTSTVAECREVLARCALLPRFPAAVRRFFEPDQLPETPKPAELNAQFSVLLDSDDLARAAAHSAEALGWLAVIDNACDDWEYREAAKYLLDKLRVLRREHSRVCLISVGEVTVCLPADDGNFRSYSINQSGLPERNEEPRTYRQTAGPSTPLRSGRDDKFVYETIPSAGVGVGIGGRNQQFALYAATLLREEDGAVTILSAGSDGIDGNSPAAGAVVNETTALGSMQKNAALLALEDFDAYSFLSARNATIVTGPTGNNLRDLRILLA